jgi:hypothetical protein
MENSFLNLSIKTLNLFLDKIYLKMNVLRTESENNFVKEETIRMYDRFCNVL